MDKSHLIVINTPGGDVQAAQGITDVMKMAVPSTTTFCSNQASSAGLEVLTSGSKNLRYASESCVGVAHHGYQSIEGTNADDIEEQQRYNTILDTRSGFILKNDLLDEQCLTALWDNGDNYLGSNDLLNVGIVDAVILPEGKMKVRADDYRIEFQACEAPINAEQNRLRSLNAKGELNETEVNQLSQAYQACYLEHGPQ